MAVGPSLMLGTLFAVASAISGYFLSKEGGYDDRLLETHETLGIATAIFPLLSTFFMRKPTFFFRKKINAKHFTLFCSYRSSYSFPLRDISAVR